MVDVQAITDRNGGVDARYLPTLQRLFQNEAQLERRLVLMTILKQSPPGTLREVVRGQKIVLELQKWLQSAAEAKEIRLAFRVIETLDKLPIDLPLLQASPMLYVGFPGHKPQISQLQCVQTYLDVISQGKGLIGGSNPSCA